MTDQGNKTTTQKKPDDSVSDLVVPSEPLGGILGETEIAGMKVGFHMTTRGAIGAGYVVLGIGLAITGLVFVVGGLNETKSLVRTITGARGAILNGWK